ncbi:MAG: hypothetical protein L3J63_08450 [Geopsychrobacter sp.]|nr:hypothetical protein [Geopsychrobacter sp.]
MHLVVIYGWQKEDTEVSNLIAATLGILVFEARQRVACGSPVVLGSFSDSQQAKGLADRLAENGVPALVIDSQSLRNGPPPCLARRFMFGAQSLQIEFIDAESIKLDYARVDLLLCATSIVGEMPTETTEIKRKFSLGKTLLAGGVPMTKKVTLKTKSRIVEPDETLWMYAQGQAPVAFNRAMLKYDGLGDAMQMTRTLNFTYLKQELRRLTPQAIYDDRLLEKPRLARLLGPSLCPETDLDLAFEVLSRTHLERG